MLNISKQKLIIFIALGLVAIIALSIGIATILSPKKTPVSADYITVTIDNSVAATFTLNKTDYSVISIETVNKADSFLVDGIPSRISFTQAINSFIANMLDANKLDKQGKEVLLFAVESRNPDDFEQLADFFRSALKENECNSRIYTLYFKVKEDSITTYALNNNSSYAKAHLCKKIEKETSLTADELISLSVTQIVEQVNKAAKDDLLDKIESETNEEQKKEEIKEEVSSTPPQSSSSQVGGSSESSSSEEDTSSDVSSDSSSSDDTSSDDTSSDDTSSGDTSSKNSFGVESNDDEDRWSDIY